MESQKKKRYDRQLRMWGEHGQMALEKCKLCLLNGSATGTEALKNLVLPGIGAFTVVDGSVVTERDLGNNFFLEPSHLGQPRAQCVTELLQELNEHSRGSFINEEPAALIASRPAFLDGFTHVIATQMPEGPARALARACAERRLPVIFLRSYGLCGVVRVCAAEATVVEAHGDNAPSDLRVCAPFPELVAYVEERFKSLEALSPVERKHVPYVVLLLRALARYRQAHSGALPASYKDKQEVKGILAGMAEEWFGTAGALDAINFDEARAAINTSLAVPSVPAATRGVLEEAKARVARAGTKAPGNGDPPITDFWVLAAAVERFVANEGGGALPLLGALPDMTSDTESYVKLAAAYQLRAALDTAAVHAHAAAIAASLGLPEGAVSADQARLFCKNAHALRWMRFRSLEEELTPATAKVSQIASLLEDGSEAPAAALYLLLRAADAFHAQFNRWPGTMDDDVEADVPLLKQCLGNVLGELRAHTTAPLAVKDDVVFEVCRYGGGEIHTVASVVGGVGAQEAIKVITGQFVPLNNTFVYKGLNGTGLTAEF